MADNTSAVRGEGICWRNGYHDVDASGRQLSKAARGEGCFDSCRERQQLMRSTLCTDTRIRCIHYLLYCMLMDAGSCLPPVNSLFGRLPRFTRLHFRQLGRLSFPLPTNFRPGQLTSMAPKQQGRGQGLKASMLLDSQGQFHSPQKAKITKSPKKSKASASKKRKTVNINGMFDFSALKHGTGSVKPRIILSPAKAGVQKSSVKKPGFFSRLHEQKKELATASPLPLSKPDIFAEYREEHKTHSMGIAGKARNVPCWCHSNVKQKLLSHI